MIIRISSRAVKGLLRHLVRSYHAYDQTIKSLLDRAKSGETEEMQKKIQELRSVSRVLIDFNKEIANASPKSEHTLLDTLTTISYDNDRAHNLIMQQKRRGLTHVRKFLKDGVDVDLNIFPQERISGPLYANQKKRLIFTPTISVTTPIFKTLLQDKPDKGSLIMFGQYGISKTISIMLFCHFSEILNRYLYLAPEEERREFVKSLGEDVQYIPKKIFYWSMVGLKSDIDRQIEEERIMSQATQLDMPNISILNMKRRYQRKGIKCAVVFDQMNAIAAKLRQANKANDTKQIPLKDIKAELKPTTQALRFHDQLKNLGFSIYNSSVNYERNLIYENSGKVFNFGLSKHTPIPTKFIDYSANYGTKLRTAQNCEFLERELESQLPPQEYLKIKGSIRELALNYFPESYLVRSYMIFSAIQAYSKQIPEKQQHRKDWMVHLLERIRQRSLEVYSENLQKYLKKDRQPKRVKLFEEIYYIFLKEAAKRMQKEGDSKGERSQAEEGSILVPTNELSKFSISDKEDIVSQELFSFIQDSRSSKVSHIKVLMPIKGLQDLITRDSQQFTPPIVEAWCRVLPQLYRDQESGTSFGNMFEMAFLNGIRANSKNDNLFLSFDNNLIHIKSQSSFQEITQFKEIEKDSGKSEDNGKTDNQSKKESENQFNNLDQIIQECSRNKNSYVFGFPARDDGSFAKTSPSIEFMIAIIYQTINKPKLIINSFDFATSKSDSNINKKLALNAFKELRQKNERTQEFSEIEWYQNIVTTPSLKKIRSNMPWPHQKLSKPKKHSTIADIKQQVSMSCVSWKMQNHLLT